MAMLPAFPTAVIRTSATTISATAGAPAAVTRRKRKKKTSRKAGASGAFTESTAKWCRRFTLEEDAFILLRVAQHGSQSNDALWATLGRELDRPANLVQCRHEMIEPERKFTPEEDKLILQRADGYGLKKDFLWSELGTAMKRLPITVNRRYLFLMHTAAPGFAIDNREYEYW